MGLNIFANRPASSAAPAAFGTREQRALDLPAPRR